MCGFLEPTDNKDFGFPILLESQDNGNFSSQWFLEAQWGDIYP